MDLGRSLGLSTARKIKRTCTQDYIPIKDIINGVIITTDNRYIQILEITPIDYALRSRGEQLAILKQFNAWLKTAPRNFQIKCYTRNTKVESYIDNLSQALKHETSEKCKEMALDHMTYLRNQGRYSSVERHYYLIYEYEPDAEFFRRKNQDEILLALSLKTQSIISGFKAIGNIIRGVPSDADIAEFLYEQYNRLSLNKYPFSSRVDRIINDTMRINELNDESQLPPADIRDLVAPRSIDTTHPEFMIIDGMYRSHYFIRSDGFPPSVTPTGWLSQLITFGSGFDVDIFFQRKGSVELLPTLKNRRKFASLRYEDSSQDNMDFEKMEDKLYSLNYLLNAITTGQDVYDLCVIITVHAYTLEELSKKKRVLYEQTQKAGILLGDCTRFQEEAFFTTSPFNDLSPKIYNLAKQNVTTETVTAAYPFTNFSLTDKKGILLGLHKSNNSLVLHDIFDSEKYSNANLGIYGASGKGKTYTLLAYTSRLRYQGVQCFILAPDKQHEFRRICTELDGIFVDMSPASRQRINPLDIWPKDSIDNSLLDGVSYVASESWLVEKIENLTMWMHYLRPDLTEDEDTLIGTALLRAYAKKGITKDNQSIYIDRHSGTKKEMPIIGDFVDELKKMPDIRKEIITTMSRFTEGTASNMNGQTNVDLTNKYIVFGLENLKGNMQAATMYIVLEYIWSITRSNRTKKKIIAIDEVWKLLDPRRPEVGDFVVEIYKVIRGFGGGAMVATQSITDLYRYGSNFGNSILANSYTNVVLGMVEKESDFIAEELGLSDRERQEIATYLRGDALLCAGHTHLPIKVTASHREHLAFTTSRSDLEIIARRKKQEQEI